MAGIIDTKFKKKGYNKNLIFKYKIATYCLKSYFIFVLIIAYILSFNKTKTSSKRKFTKRIYQDQIKSNPKNRTNITRIENNYHIINKTNYQYFCCFCAIGREENRYSRELISYYLGLGVEKFVFGDNNLPNTEKLADVLQDYIKNGTVDIIDINDTAINQAYFYGIVYEKYKQKCNWLTFFDFDEYLYMESENGTKLNLREYLNLPTYDQCEAIIFNWLMYGDNELVHYDNRTSIVRFTRPDYNNYANRFVKTIVRGNLSKAFGIGSSIHLSNREIKKCNSLGKTPRYYPDSQVPPVHQNAYIMHFNTRTAEEYVKKIRKGSPGGFKFDVNERVNLFFVHNRFTKEKLKVFEEAFNRTFSGLGNRPGI